MKAMLDDVSPSAAVTASSNDLAPSEDTIREKWPELAARYSSKPRVEVTPDDTPQEKKVYMPGEQAKELMARHDEVKNLVKDFELDIK